MKTNFKILSFVFVFVLLFGLLSVCVSASSVDDFLLVPYSDSNSNGVLIGVRTNGLSAYLRGSSDTSPIYCALCGSDLALFSLDSSGYVCYTVNLDGSVSQNGGATTYYNTFVIDGVTYHYVPNMPYAPIATYDSSIPVFSDLASAQAAFADFIQNPPSPSPPPSDFSFDLPAGNAAYIEIASGGTSYSLSAKMPQLSVLWLAGSQPVFWPGDYASWFRVSSVPSAGSAFDNSDETLIDWQRGSNVNGLSQTDSAVYSGTVSSGDRNYLVIYNPPYYYHSGGGSSASSSPTIHIELENALSVTAFSVTGGTISNPTLSLGGVQYDLDPDGTWTDSDGSSNAPPVGGGNYVPDDGDLISVLSGLVSDIDNFFKGTWSYINSLVTILGDFPGYIVQLYSWLPAELRAPIFAAFSIALTVGVLKVML